jgi:hypothetical protein
LEQSKRWLVVTEYSQELSWLLFELKAILYDKLDYIIKYDFYGSLAQAALEHLEANKKADLNSLLFSAIKALKRFEL